MLYWYPPTTTSTAQVAQKAQKMPAELPVKDTFSFFYVSLFKMFNIKSTPFLPACSPQKSGPLPEFLISVNENHYHPL